MKGIDLLILVPIIIIWMTVELIRCPLVDEDTGEVIDRKEKSDIDIDL